jgi:hypothetical protein
MGAFLSGYSTGYTVTSKPWEQPTVAEIVRTAKEEIKDCAGMRDTQLLEHLTIQGCKVDDGNRTEITVNFHSNPALRAKEGARARGEIPD